MSTVVLARKYRPRSFAQMVGQEHVVRALTNALQTRRLHHAYLFTGTRGIGKTTVSRILAKSLNCTGPDGRGDVTAEPCGVCTACTEIDADRFIDYIELDAASNRSIDEIRDLIERAAYKPSVGRYKVFMIDEAHQLTKDAFNALLKTLEEPPEYLKFVLATTDPEKMLPTVLSRCLQFNLRPMAPEVVRDHLAHVLAAETVPADEGALRLLARAARGSMRDALSLTDQAIAYGGGRLDEGVVRAMLGAVDRGHAVRIVEALAGRDGPALLAAVDALRAQGLSAAGTLEEIASLLQGMAVEQAVPGALDATNPEHDDARRLAPVLAADETQLLYSIVMHGRGELALMSDEYGALTMVLLRLLAFPPAGDAPPRAPAPAVNAAAGAAPASRPAAVTASAARPSPAPTGAPPAPSTVAPTRPPGAAMRPPAAPAPAAPAAAAPTDLPGTLSRPASAPPAPVAAAPVARDLEPPPWLDDVPPDDDGAPEPPPRSAPLRAPAPPAISLPVAPPSTPAAGGADALPVLEKTPLGDRWAALAARMAEAGAISALVRELAWQGGLVAAGEGEGAVWRLVVERDSLRSTTLADRLAAALGAELGHSVRLELQPGVPTDSPARRDAHARAQRQREAEAIIRSDPVVVELLSQFRGARIVPGSIKPV